MDSFVAQAAQLSGTALAAHLDRATRDASTFTFAELLDLPSVHMLAAGRATPAPGAPPADAVGAVLAVLRLFAFGAWPRAASAASRGGRAPPPRAAPTSWRSLRTADLPRP